MHRYIMTKRLLSPDAGQGTILSDNHSLDDLLVVGIGASDGGIEALRSFFEHVDDESGLAYMVVLHLPAAYERELTDILQRTSKIPVTLVSERVEVQPDHIYILPSSQHVLMIDGHVAVSPQTLVQDQRAPVDMLLRTLAGAY